MGGIPKRVLLGVAAVLGLCALTGFAMGLSSTLARKASTADEEAPIASNLPANVTVRDAQPLAPPPPPPAPAKPKTAVAEAASDQPPADAAAKTPAESAPNTPIAPAPAAPKPAAPTRLPDDLPPT